MGVLAYRRMGVTTRPRKSFGTQANAIRCRWIGPLSKIGRSSGSTPIRRFGAPSDEQELIPTKALPVRPHRELSRRHQEIQYFCATNNGQHRSLSDFAPD